MTAVAAAFVPVAGALVVVVPEEVVMTAIASVAAVSVTATTSAVLVPVAVVVGAYVPLAAVEYVAFRLEVLAFGVGLACRGSRPGEGYGEEILDKLTLPASGVSSAE